MVGEPGLEPGTSASRTQRATKLRYSPKSVRKCTQAVRRAASAHASAGWTRTGLSKPAASCSILRASVTRGVARFGLTPRGVEVAERRFRKRGPAALARDLLEQLEAA